MWSQPNLELALFRRGHRWLRGIARLVPGILAAHEIDLLLFARERPSAALADGGRFNQRHLFLRGFGAVVNRARIGLDVVYGPWPAGRKCLSQNAQLAATRVLYRLHVAHGLG